MTAPSPETVARALHAQVGYFPAKVNGIEVGGSARPICLCGANLPAISAAITDGDAEAAGALVHAMHVQDVLDEVRGFRTSDDPPGLDKFT